jgi:two-component system nitrogen regulation response regulator GlnG
MPVADALALGGQQQIDTSGSDWGSDMPFDLQTRLLRVLSDGQFYRVGGHNPMRSNVRVIAATHQNLEDRVKLGIFREDLFHRLNVIRLRLPALRERQEDVPALARFFLQKSAKDLGVEAKRITDAALSRLMQFDFPGNVRQLENICHWLTVMAPAQSIEPKDLPPEFQTPVALQASAALPVVSVPPAPVPGPGPQHEAIAIADLTSDVGGLHALPPDIHAELPAGADVLPSRWLVDLERESRGLLLSGEPQVWDILTRKFEAQLIHTALDVTRGRRIEAAQKLGIGRNTITRKIQELGLDD